MRGIVCAAVSGLALAVTWSPAFAAERKPAPEGAVAYIIWPKDGAVIPGGKFWLRMGLSGAGIAPAGIDRPHTGHHHLLVDVDLPDLDRAHSE